jgi:hypothetical protein
MIPCPKKKGARGAPVPTAALQAGIDTLRAIHAAEDPPVARPADGSPVHATHHLPMAVAAAAAGTADVLQFYNIRMPARPDWAGWELRYPRLARLRGPAAARLREAGVQLAVVPEPLDPVHNAYYDDFIWDAAATLVPDIGGRPTLAAALLLDAAGQTVADPRVTIHHGGVRAAAKAAVRRIMGGEFGAAFAWDGTDGAVMTLQLA